MGEVILEAKVATQPGSDEQDVRESALLNYAYSCHRLNSPLVTRCGDSNGGQPTQQNPATGCLEGRHHEADRLIYLPAHLQLIAGGDWY
jgi:hypothetical protein